MASAKDFFDIVIKGVYKDAKGTVSRLANEAAIAGIKASRSAAQASLPITKAEKAAWLKNRYRSYAKGIGMHAAVGAVIGGGNAAYRGDDVMSGAWRGAKMGAFFGLAGSAYRSFGQISNVAYTGRNSLYNSAIRNFNKWNV